MTESVTARIICESSCCQSSAKDALTPSRIFFGSSSMVRSSFVSRCSTCGTRCTNVQSEHREALDTPDATEALSSRSDGSDCCIGSEVPAVVWDSVSPASLVSNS